MTGQPTDGPVLTTHPSEDGNHVVVCWENRDRDLMEIDLSFEEAAAMMAGKPVGPGYDQSRVRRTTRAERLAALRARQSQIRARMDDLEQGEWDT